QHRHTHSFPTRRSSDLSTGRDSRPKPCFCRKKHATRWRPLADRPCTPIYWASSTPKPTKPCTSNPACPTIWRGFGTPSWRVRPRSEEHTSELQSLAYLV